MNECFITRVPSGRRVLALRERARLAAAARRAIQTELCSHTRENRQSDAGDVTGKVNGRNESVRAGRARLSIAPSIIQLPWHCLAGRGLKWAINRAGWDGKRTEDNYDTSTWSRGVSLDVCVCVCVYPQRC